MENQEEKEYKCVVYEHRKGGGRFMTAYTEGNEYEDNEHHIIVEAGVSEETGKLLCKERRVNNLSGYLDGLPDFIRSPEHDAFIASMLLEEE